jgi:glycosyltransferase involved in cell wall biosynthesis
MNLHKPLISIMVPVYNGDDTLPIAVASLLLQTYTNWRCIIVNDGSTDGTKAFLDGLTDSRFQVIHLKENRGRPNARQVALNAAEGDYLAFLDADDFYHPLKLERQLAVMEQHPEVLLTCCANGSYGNDFTLERVRGKGKGTPVKFLIGDRRNVVLRTAMVRLPVAKKYQFNTKLKLAEDTDYVDRMLHNQYALTTAEVYYYYSEFTSVTGKKILKSYYYDALYYASILKYGFAKHLKSIFKTVGKYAVTATLLPFVGVNFFLRRRGKLPTASEIKEFEQLKQQLNLKPAVNE